MNKEIEEMAKLACSVFDGNCEGCAFNFYHPCPPKASAERIYNAGYRKQEWISVGERLPESDGEFLVWNDFYGAIVGHYWARGKYFISKAVTVTHWMPLPEPPKGEGK